MDDCFLHWDAIQSPKNREYGFAERLARGAKMMKTRMTSWFFYFLYDLPGIPPSQRDSGPVLLRQHRCSRSRLHEHNDSESCGARRQNDFRVRGARYDMA
jgi:hypothetical protein